MTKWTEKQQQVIDARDASILVSASAGSGKTAVLVERILTKVISERTDTSERYNIDDFLVVTFTKAAAAQMREKISARLEKELEKYPEDEHLAKQLVLVNHADITTIDSFCLRLVKEHFSLLNLDSVFQIADNGMITLLQADVMKELMDEQYHIPDNTPFHRLLDYFECFDKEDDLQAVIYRIFNVASGYSCPKEWVHNAKKQLLINSVAELEQAEWLKTFIKTVQAQARDAIVMIRELTAICESGAGPDVYIPALESDLHKVEAICEAETYEAMRQGFQSGWARLASAKKDVYGEEMIKDCQTRRDAYKKIISGCNVFAASAEEIVEQIQSTATFLTPLLDLVLQFMERFDAAKEKRKLMTFSDVEHLAYQLVCAGKQNGKQIPTEVGKQVSKRYKEIYIDEYQDSNFLQEDILCSISGMYRGDNNLFMVGDVKQSIYRFRMARPDLFMQKYRTFQETGNEIKIELLHNFRSRDIVLNATNYFFYQLMGEDLGGIAYNKNAALIPGRAFLDATDKNVSSTAEVLIVDCDSDVVLDEELTEELPAVDTSHMTGLQLEAHMIAQKIEEIVNGKNPLFVYDEALDNYRKAKYRDIVILVRAVKGTGETMRNALSMQGIPVYLEDPKGYFNAVEIRVILSYLAVIDNARQDIPLSAVLLSPIGRLTDNELACVCSKFKGQKGQHALLYEKCRYYMDEYEDPISTKLKAFFDLLDELKQKKMTVSISSLIWEALNRTGYYDYASAMPMGEKRRANIDMLLEKANTFENGYYKGLFHFLRYIEKLKLQDADFGEANILSDDEDVVRIMSMHKSKGLEYPIVFVSGLGKRFNKQDTRQMLVIHSDYGLASMMFSEEERYKKKTFARSVFSTLLDNESMAEEMRILYVAMTRAKEKLYLTGAVRSYETSCEKLTFPVLEDSYLLPFGIRKKALCYMDYIIACMQRYDELKEVLNVSDILNVSVCSTNQVAANIHLNLISSQIQKEELKGMAIASEENAYYEEYKAAFDYTYPYQVYTDMRGKMSISDIKKMKAYDGQGYDADTEFTYAKEQTDIIQAEDLQGEDLQGEDLQTEGLQKDGLQADSLQGESFRKEATSSRSLHITGALYGTIIHKFMELLPFEQLSGVDDKDYYEFVRSFKQLQIEKGIFDKEEAAVISVKKIVTMLKSPLGKRMVFAAENQLLYKEQQFSAGIKPSELDNNLPNTDDLIIVQGIIDAFFYEDGEIVLMDYKTDHADEATIKGRYNAQMEYYARILEQLTGCKVKSQIFYSFYLGKEISLESHVTKD